MSLTAHFLNARKSRFPRVSGDEPAQLPNIGQSVGFSPRERG